MPSAENELQAAIHVALNGDETVLALLGGPNIFDQTPPRVKLPFITYAGTSSLDWSTSTEDGEELIFSVEIWTAGNGKAEAFEIAGRVRAILDSLAFPENNFRLVLITLVSADTEYEDEAAAYRCLLQYRALMERV
jgi:hypothetical protein